MKYHNLLIRFGIYLIAAGLYVTAAQLSGAENLRQGHSAAVSASRTAEDRSITLGKLVGRWNRTDGSYAIEIHKIDSGDKLGAASYTPKPIHVAQTKISSENGGIKIFIELRDTGYPGSTYTLDYMPSEDILKGTYFQAGIQQHFQVFFIREKK